jgi:hypothetical protein
MVMAMSGVRYKVRYLDDHTLQEKILQILATVGGSAKNACTIESIIEPKKIGPARDLILNHSCPGLPLDDTSFFQS